jgi:hypothetical protein
MGDVANIKLRFVANYGHVEEFFNWLGNRREFLAVDVETTGLIVGHDYIRLAQFGDGETGWAFDYSEWKGAVRDAILRYDRPMVAHNLLFDSKMLLHDGIEIPQHLAHDSMVMTHLADPKGYMGLKPAAARYIDKRAAAGQDLLKKAMAQGAGRGRRSRRTCPPTGSTAPSTRASPRSWPRSSTPIRRRRRTRPSSPSSTACVTPSYRASAWTRATGNWPSGSSATNSPR